MSDWRLLGGQEEYFKGKSLKKVKFPEFWQSSYAQKNDFFRKVEKQAFEFVQHFGKYSELLKDERIQEFWHEHCDFCTKTILTTDNRICYCEPDYYTWICEECFNDFKEKFNWDIVE